MSEFADLTVDRRRVLEMLSATAAGGIAATAGVTAQADTYRIAQGGQCTTLVPIQGELPVEEFYEYDAQETQYSPGGPILNVLDDLMQAGRSLLFLHRGPEGRTSLVAVHGEYVSETESQPENGGSVTFVMSGVSGGEFVVRDDQYDGPMNYDQWDVDGDEAVIDWTWAGNRVDGMVFSPVGDATIAIDPAFNQEAALYGEFYQGDVQEWIALTGPRDDLGAVELAMNQPITIEPGSC